MVPRPTLWDSTDGRLKYEPAAFQPMHHRSFTTEVSGRFKMGVLGVAGILQDYAHMSEESRHLMDAELAKRVYRSLMTDDDPVRVLLHDKLDPVQDAKERLRLVFDAPMNGDEDDNSQARFEHAFDLIDRLNPEQMAPVLKVAEVELGFMLRDDDGPTFIESYAVAIPILSKTLEKLQNKGLDLITPVSRFFQQALGEELIVSMISVASDVDNISLTSDQAIVISTLIAMPEETLLDLDLADDTLISLMKNRSSSPGIRDRLMNTRKGREALLGADLGI